MILFYQMQKKKLVLYTVSPWVFLKLPVQRNCRTEQQIAN